MCGISWLTCHRSEVARAKSANKPIVDELKAIAEGYESVRDQWRARAHQLAAGTIARLTFKVTSVDQLVGRYMMGKKVLRKIGEFLAFGQTVKMRLKENDQALRDREAMGRVFGVGNAMIDKLVLQGVCSVEQMRQHQELLSPQQVLGLRFVEECVARFAACARV